MAELHRSIECGKFRNDQIRFPRSTKEAVLLEAYRETVRCLTKKMSGRTGTEDRRVLNGNENSRAENRFHQPQNRQLGHLANLDAFQPE